jgi:hypothetical protein
MMSATKDNPSFGSFSRTHSSSEDNHTRATTPNLIRMMGLHLLGLREREGAGRRCEVR